ncbi:Mu homology domain-containing protein [Cladochytrium replicatum]|nr:Mu homology domain-containing protein [Cladochytrium replicatum]
MDTFCYVYFRCLIEWPKHEWLQPSMIDSLFILDGLGNVIIEKHWRTVVPRSAVQQFWDLLNAKVSNDTIGENGVRPPTQLIAARPLPSSLVAAQELEPVLVTDRYFFLHILRSGLYFLAVVHDEAPPLSVLHFLHRAVDIMQEYFGIISEITIKENFVIVYELLEELLDYGRPHMIEPNILRSMIPPPSIMATVMNAVSLSGVGTSGMIKYPSGPTSSIPWRSSGIKYTKNEIYFDLVEDLHVILDKSSQVVVADIQGQVLCTCRLSGMPDLMLRLVNGKSLEDGMTSFHPCVRSNRYEKERSISFVPPDGPFTLMTYCTNIAGPQFLPLVVRPQLIATKQGGKLEISVQPRYTSTKAVEALFIAMALPTCIKSVSITSTIGQASFDQISQQIKWSVGKVSPDVSGSGLPLLSATLYGEGSNVEEELSKMHTIFADFQISAVSASGLRIDALHVENEGYKPFKGVRYITRSARYQIRF